MSLPYDIIFEILLRLRVKTLFRFQCVSKLWKAMISDPDFQKPYRCRAEQNHLIVVATDGLDGPYSGKIQLQMWDKRGTQIKKFVETRISSNDFWPVTTCLDLICIHNSYVAKFWNPTTEESIFLPLLKSPGCPAQNYKKKKKPHERRRTVAVAFGHISSTKVFKVLHVFDTLRPGDNKHSCEVFTLCVDDQWRAAPALPSLVHDIGEDDIAFANGAIHFLPIHEPKDVGIAAFDLKREDWSMIPSPPVPHKNPSSLFLYNLEGLLCALTYPRGKKHFDLWLLKDYKKGLWVKGYNLDLSALNQDLQFTDMFPLAIEQDGRILIQVSGLDSRWLYYYDPKGKNHEQIKKFPDCWFRTNIYMNY